MQMTEQGGVDSDPPHPNVDLKGKSETMALDYIPHKLITWATFAPKATTTALEPSRKPTPNTVAPL